MKFRLPALTAGDGPLGPHIDSCAAGMRGEGYAQRTSELQIRLAAGFPGDELLAFLKSKRQTNRGLTRTTGRVIGRGRPTWKG
jgi:hypothetical protein